MINKINDNYYLIQEHHELLIVARAYVDSLSKNSIFVNVDAHNDMLNFVFRSKNEINYLKLSNNDINNFVYDIPTIGNFFTLLLRDSGANYIWINRLEKTFYSEFSIQPNFLPDGKMCLIVNKEIPTAKKQFFISCKLEDTIDLFLSNADFLMLSIDLDFFATDNYQGGKYKIGLSNNEYDSYIRNPLHPLRFRFGGLADIIFEDGIYYLYCMEYPHADDECCFKDNIISRLESFYQWYNKYHMYFNCVVICESAISGFTSSKYYSYVKQKVLDIVSSYNQVSHES